MNLEVEVKNVWENNIRAIEKHILQSEEYLKRLKEDKRTPIRELGRYEGYKRDVVYSINDQMIEKTGKIEQFFPFGIRPIGQIPMPISGASGRPVFQERSIDMLASKGIGVGRSRLSIWDICDVNKPHEFDRVLEHIYIRCNNAVVDEVLFVSQVLRR